MSLYLPTILNYLHDVAGNDNFTVVLLCRVIAVDH